MGNMLGAVVTQQVTINRGTIQELDEAIEELKLRGYELVKRDDVAAVTYGKNFNYNDGRGSRYKYKGDDVSFSKCKAVMKRIVPYGEGIK